MTRTQEHQRAWRRPIREDERIVGHAADPYHRIDIRQTSRHLTVRYQDQVIADTRRPLALYESGFAPRWYVPRADVDEAALTPAQAGMTVTPTLLSVNVGLPKNVAWQDKSVYAGAWKHPVDVVLDM